MTAHRILPSLFLLTMLTACGDRVRKSDYEGTYRVKEAVLLEGTRIRPDEVAKLREYVLTLEPKGNFRLQKEGKVMYGFWDVTDAVPGRPLLLQSGQSVYLPFTGSEILFNQTRVLLDSQFVQAIFEKEK